MLEAFEEQPDLTLDELQLEYGDALSCVVCKFQLSVVDQSLMKLEGCGATQQHLIHGVCFAKDLAALIRLGPQCTICVGQTLVTIHDTDCLDPVDGESPSQDYDDIPDNFKQIDDLAMVPGFSNTNLMATNPLDKAIDTDDEDIY